MLLVRLSHLFTGEALQAVFLAFQETPTLWQALQEDTDLAQKALVTLGEQPQAWTPWAVARLVLDLPQEEGPLPQSIRHEAVQTFLTFREQPAPPADPHSVALLSLVVAEHLRRQPLDTLVEQVLGQPPWVAWHEPFAAASALADFDALTTVLLRHHATHALPLLLAVALARPEPPSTLAAMVRRLAERLLPEQRVSLLEHLLHRRPDVLAALRPTWPGLPLPQAHTHFEQALLALTHDPEAAHQALTVAWEHLRRFQAQLAAYLGTLAEHLGDPITAQTAWAQAAEHAPDQPVYLAHRVLNLLAADHLEAAHNLLPEAPEHPALALAAAALAQRRGETELARQAADRALAGAEALPAALLARLAELFLALEQPQQALQCWRLALRRAPTQATWHDRAAQAAERLAHAQAALYHRACALHLQPTPARRRAYARALSQAQRWREARLAWQALLDEDPSTTAADWCALAEAALRDNHPETALQAAEQALARTPDHPSALALRGEALAALGRLTEAVEHLRHAIAQAPQAPELPLALARVQQAQGHAEKAHETLRLAAQAFPEHAAVQATWGRALLMQGRFAQAVPPLQAAHRLAPDDPTPALDLARALLALHRTEETLALLTRLSQRWPHLPALAALHGQALLQAGRPKEALAPLAQAIQAGITDPDLLLRYADAVLATDQDPQTAVQALLQAQQLLPDEAPPDQRAEIGLTLGRAYLALGQPQAALATYRDLLQRGPYADPTVPARAAKGLARAALALGSPDTAIAALEEALAQQADDTEALDLLAQAALAARLPDRALEAARRAFALHPHDAEAALRFARFALDLERPYEATDALERALAANPRHASLYLTLADAYHQAGAPKQARAALDALLAAHERRPFPPATLAEAGRRLLHLGEPEKAALCLSTALEAEPEPPFAWRLALVQALRQQGALALALEKADQALANLPTDDPDVAFSLHLERAHLFAALQRTAEAQSALEQAEQTARNAEHFAALAHAWLAHDAPLRALNAAEQALALQPQRLDARLAAAEAALALAQPEQARRWLGPLPKGAPTAQATRWHHLLAETALDLDDADAATQALAACEQHEASAWTWALQARLAHAQGDREHADQTLEQAFAALGEVPRPAAAPAWESVARAALDLAHWDAAVEIARRVAQACPGRARAALLWAEALVRRAEVLPLAEQAECHDAPSTAARAEGAHRQWEQALQQAARALNLPEAPDSPLVWAGHPTLGRWLLRGLALWSPEVPLQELLGPTATPGDVAAALGAARRLPALRTRLPRPLPHQTHPLVQVMLGLLAPSPEQGLPFLRRAIEAAPHEPLYLALLGRWALRSGRYAEALQAYRGALTLRSNEPRWHLRAAEAAAHLGEQGMRLEHLEAAHCLRPAEPHLALALAEAYLEVGRAEDARRTLQAAVELHPEHPDLLLALARAHQALGDRQTALTWAQRAQEVAPERPKSTLLFARLLLAQAPDQAVPLLEDLLKRHPGLVEAVGLLADALEAMGRAEEALQRLEQALAHLQDETALPLQVRRAELLHRLHGPAAAVEAWQALTQARPDLPHLWLGLAETLAAAGKSEAALAAAHKAERRADALPTAQRARLHLLLGRLARQQGQLDRAVHHLYTALDLASEAEIYLELGRAEHERRRLRAALEALHTAIRLVPDDPRPYYHAGLVLRDLQDFAEAERMLRQAQRLAPDDPAVNRALAGVAAVNLLRPS